MIVRTIAEMRQAIHRCLDETESLCVFPTETSARFWTTDYVLASDRSAVLLDRIVAWDEFRSRVLPRRAEAPANGFIRQIFALDLLRQPDQVRSLQWFVYPEYPEAVESLAPSIAGLITLIPSIDRMRIRQPSVYGRLPAAYRADVARIDTAYRRFLSERGLYEPLFEKPSAKNLAGHAGTSLHIFFPEVTEEWDEFICMGDVFSRIETYSFGSIAEVPSIEVYDNELVELRACLQTVCTLLAEGEDPSDIMITVGDRERWRPYLLQEASIRDVPLVFVEGDSPLSHPAGRFLGRLRDIYVHRFSLSVMKEFLLDPRYPWRNARLAEELVARAVELSVSKGSLDMGSDEWELKLGSSPRERDRRLAAWYRRFKKLVTEVVTSDTAAGISRNLFLLQKELLSDKAWNETDGEAGGDSHEGLLYAYCLERLHYLGRAMDACGMQRFKGLYPLYLQVLQRLRYVPADRPPGIPVYSYGFSIGMCVKHHFLLGISHEVTSVRRGALPLLADTPVNEDAESNRMRGETMMNHLAFSAEQVRFSYGRELFGNGSALAPAWFLEHGSVIVAKRDRPDVFRVEQEAWAGHRPSSCTVGVSQHRWFDQALNTVFLPMGCDIAEPHRTMAFFGRAADEDGLVPISSTALDQFTACPMRWACTYLFCLRKGQYDVVPLDHAKIGVLLHDVLAQFFRETTERYGPYDPELSDRYLAVLRGIMDAQFARFARSPDAPGHTTLRYIEARYGGELEMVVKAEGMTFAGFRSIGFEVPLDYSYPERGYRLNGRIDRVLVRDDGKSPPLLAVVDYKKSFHDSRRKYDRYRQSLPSHQLPVYAKLLADTKAMGARDVAVGAFYDIGKGKYHLIWDEGEPDRRDGMGEILDADLEAMVGSLQSGTLGARPSKEHCAYCDFRQICRRRYALP